MTSERGRGFIRMTLLILALSLPLTTGKAQAGLGLSLVAEYPLGDACPVTGVVSPDGDAVWALMVDCINDYTASLQAYSTADGASLGRSNGAFPMDIAGTELYGSDRPLVIASDGSVTADFVDWMTGVTASFAVDTTTGLITPIPDSPRFLSTDAILAALPDFAGYTDYLTYSDDRSLALVQDEVFVYVFDVDSGTEIMRLTPPGGVEYAGVWFGPNNAHLYVSQMEDPGNYDNPAQILHVFDIPTGDLVSTTAVPHRIYAVSPNERLLVVSTPVMGGDNESLAVFELATGAMSESLPTRSTLVQLNICKNDGRMTDFGWTSDDPGLREILWLPDSSGFVTLNSSEFNSGPNPCLTNDSRLRVYAVTGA